MLSVSALAEHEVHVKLTAAHLSGDHPHREDLRIKLSWHAPSDQRQIAPGTRLIMLLSSNTRQILASNSRPMIT